MCNVAKTGTADEAEEYERRIEIIKTIAPDWKQVGFLVDFDPMGRTVANIEKQHGHKCNGPVICCQEIFTLWLDQPDANWGISLKF